MRRRAAGLSSPDRFVTIIPVKTPSPIARLVAVAAVMAAAGLAAAQPTPQAPQARPPTAASTDKPPLFTYIMAVVVGAMVVGGNLIPSKRGHQD